jgi:hypothetical protein
MADRRHLSVVRTPEEEHAAKVKVLRDCASRVPSRMERTYDWRGDDGESLMHAIHHFITAGMSIDEIEQVVDMEGLRSEFLNWLERQG